MQEECEEIIDDNAPIYADAVVAVIISLILLTIVFEKLHEVLEEKAKETMHGLEGVVDALMGELTVLGLLPSSLMFSAMELPVNLATTH